MRLGIMLRHFDQHDGGVKVYTRELLKAMIALNTRHEIVLLFRTRQLGSYVEGARAEAVREILLEGGPILVWDQIKVPQAVREHGIDVLFNPKYSIPLRAGCKTVWVCHGLDWYVMPEASRWIDRLSHRFLVPQYAAKADAVVAVSETTRQHLMQYLNVPPDRARTVYSGLSDAFRKPPTEEQLEATRRRWQLPPRFLLYCGAVYPPKNFRRMIRAYARVGPAQGVPLVIAGGSNRFLSQDELYEPERLKIGHWVRWLGWLDNAQLPALYRLADGLLLPSLYESVGMPIMEAMASQCPVLTANRYGTRELADGAAILIDPESVDDIAAGIHRLLHDRPLRNQIVAAGLERSRAFTWESTAAGVWQVLESL
jgi:glycosyltransferase involved in cell wall biosynthesis